MDDGAEHEQVSLHVRAACAGDESSLSWLILRFSPNLFTQARFRLGRGGIQHYSPEDLVQDVWAVALTKLPTLELSGIDDAGRIRGFLGRTLLNLYGNLLQKHIMGKPVRVHLHDESGNSGLAGLSEHASGVVTKVARNEHKDALMRALNELQEADRQLVIMRGIEQIPANIIARELGVAANTIAVRYRRCLQKLADKVPPSVMADLRAS